MLLSSVTLEIQLVLEDYELLLQASRVVAGVVAVAKMVLQLCIDEKKLARQ